MRIILIGAVESTKVVLETMVNFNLPPVVLITLPLSKSYRHSDFVDLRSLAIKFNIPVIEASNINASRILLQIQNLKPDYIFVIGWSQILSKELLAIPTKDSIGYHPTPLPENRGRAVIPWTIIQCKKETGSTLFWLDEGIDSGDILLQEFFPIEYNETATALYQKHLQSLKHLMSKALFFLMEGNMPRIPQDHNKATYCAKRTPSDGFIDWNLPAKLIWTLIRAITDPYPGAFTFYNGKKLIVWEADYVEDGPFCGLPGQIQIITESGALIKCGDGKYVLVKIVQLETEKRISAKNLFKKHKKLGIDWQSLYKKFSKEINL